VASAAQPRLVELVALRRVAPRPSGATGDRATAAIPFRPLGSGRSCRSATTAAIPPSPAQKRARRSALPAQSKTPRRLPAKLPAENLFTILHRPSSILAFFPTCISQLLCHLSFVLRFNKEHGSMVIHTAHRRAAHPQTLWDGILAYSRGLAVAITFHRFNPCYFITPSLHNSAFCDILCPCS
jgi:hypothetical protein